MRSPNSTPVSGGEIDLELRLGLTPLPEKKEDAVAGSAGPMIKIKVSHGSDQREVAVPAESTFGELKSILAREIGLEPAEQRLLFRGKEKDNEECLHLVGVKDMSKLVLFEDPASKEQKLEQMKKDQDPASKEQKLEQMKKDQDPASKEQKLEQMKKDQGVAKACEAVYGVSVEVDKLCERVSALQAAVSGGTRLVEKEFDYLTELLMIQLLKLDGIEAEGEAKVQRKNEVRRIQSLVDKLDALKTSNSNLSSPAAAVMPNGDARL